MFFFINDNNIFYKKMISNNHIILQLTIVYIKLYNLYIQIFSIYFQIIITKRDIHRCYNTDQKKITPQIQTQTQDNTQQEQATCKLQSNYLIPSFFTQKFYNSLSSDREREKYMKKESPYSSCSSFQLRPFILKSDADIRQESFFIHLISIFSKIFKKEGLPIYLRDLDFIQLGRGTGLIEYVKDSASISTLKKRYP